VLDEGRIIAILCAAIAKRSTGRISALMQWIAGPPDETSSQIFIARYPRM
jgi:hypothetical protein